MHTLGKAFDLGIVGKPYYDAIKVLGVYTCIATHPIFPNSHSPFKVN